MKTHFSVYVAILCGILCSIHAVNASTPVEFMSSSLSPSSFAASDSQNKVLDQLKEWIDLDVYASVRIQTYYNESGSPDHLLVYLFSKAFHRVDFLKVNLGSEFNFASVIRDFDPSSEVESLFNQTLATCPDESVQFISFAPNTRGIEQSTATEVAEAAEAAGLKTVRLFESQATTANYLNYMSCPNLIGNFYDGDANKGEIVTKDGFLTSARISAVLRGAFRGKVTNIWVACQAYNAPMLPAMLQDAQSQKYAAGIDDLIVGPSDRTGACAMKAAIQNQSMTQAFANCRHQHDLFLDHWGFGGNGSDQLGH
jgi:hypothetical protein